MRRALAEGTLPSWAPVEFGLRRTSAAVKFADVYQFFAGREEVPTQETMDAYRARGPFTDWGLRGPSSMSGPDDEMYRCDGDTILLHRVENCVVAVRVDAAMDEDALLDMGELLLLVAPDTFDSAAAARPRVREFFIQDNLSRPPWRSTPGPGVGYPMLARLLRYVMPVPQFSHGSLGGSDAARAAQASWVRADGFFAKKLHPAAAKFYSNAAHLLSEFAALAGLALFNAAALHYYEF